MIVVVGGNARKAGKTRAVCDIIRATPEAQWVAVKVTQHAHEPEYGPATDTGRYLEAGAAEAHLIIGRPPLSLPPARNLIVESNAILDQLEPDVFVFVIDREAEWKESALRLGQVRNTIQVEGSLTEEQIAPIRAKLG